MVRGNGIHLPRGVGRCPSVWGPILLSGTPSHCPGPRPTARVDGLVSFPGALLAVRGCAQERPLAAEPPHTPRRGQAGAVLTLAPPLPSCTSAVLSAARSRSSQLGTAMAAALSLRQRGNFRPSPGSASGPAELSAALPGRRRGPALLRGPSPLRLRPPSAPAFPRLPRAQPRGLGGSFMPPGLWMLPAPGWWP